MSALPVPSRLSDLESVIERGLATFVEVGDALLAIRDERLYRETHGTFEAYLSDRWQMSLRRAYQLIDSAAVVAVMSTTVHTGPAEFYDNPATWLPGSDYRPTTERVARELVPVMRQDPVSLPAVMAEAVTRSAGQPVTAAVVREVVRDRFRSMAAESEAEMQAATAHYTPEQRASVAPERMRELGELRRLVHDLAALPDPDGYAESFGRWLTQEFQEEAAAARRWLEALMRRLEAAR